MQLNTTRITTVGLVALLALAAVVGVGTVLATDYDATPEFDWTDKTWESTDVPDADQGMVINPNDEIVRIEATTDPHTSGFQYITITNMSSGNTIYNESVSGVANTTYVFDSLSLNSNTNYSVEVMSHSSFTYGWVDGDPNFPLTSAQADVLGYSTGGIATTSIRGWQSMTFYDDAELSDYQTETVTATATATATDTATATATETETETETVTETNTTTTDSTTTDSTTTAETAISGGGAIMPSSGPPTWLQGLALAALAMGVAVLAVRRA